MTREEIVSALKRMKCRTLNLDNEDALNDFVEFMKPCQYSDDNTLNAWHFFVAGFIYRANRDT